MAREDHPRLQLVNEGRVLFKSPALSVLQEANDEVHVINNDEDGDGDIDVE